MIVGGQDAWRLTDLLKARDVPVIVSPVNALPLRRWEGYDTAYANPGKLQAAGVRFCIANDGSDFEAAHDRNLPYQAAQAAAHGLPRDEALKAVTLYPAQILGVGDRLGSLEVGKDATLIVTSGDPLEIMTQVEAAYIDGRPVDLSNRRRGCYEKYKQQVRALSSRTGRLDPDGSKKRRQTIRGDALAEPSANQPASMSNSLSDSISTLNKLIETCKDGQEGFRLAAEAVTDDEDLKGFLFSCSLQRSKFAGELQNEVIALGEPGPSETSTTVAALHRGWINLKTALTGNDNHAILAECERGEDSAVAEYRKAANSNLSDTLKEIVQRQFQEVLATHNSVRGLRDELAAQKPPTRSVGQVASDFRLQHSGQEPRHRQQRGGNVDRRDAFHGGLRARKSLPRDPDGARRRASVSGCSCACSSVQAASTSRFRSRAPCRKRAIMITRRRCCRSSGRSRSSS